MVLGTDRITAPGNSQFPPRLTDRIGYFCARPQLHKYTCRHLHALATQLHRLQAQQAQQQQGRGAPLPRRRRGMLLLWLLSLQPMQLRRQCVHVPASAGERLHAQPPKLAKKSVL